MPRLALIPVITRIVSLSSLKSLPPHTKQLSSLRKMIDEITKK